MDWISRFFYAFAALLMIVSFQNCSAGFEVIDSLKVASSAAGTSLGTIESDPILKAQAIAILQTKCSACHGTASLGNVTQILDLDHLVASGLIIPGNPNQGRLILSVQGGTMPPAPTTVSAGELVTIKNWVSSVRVVGPLPPVTGTGPVIPVGMTVSSDPALKTQALRLLQVDCAGCHQSVAEGGISNIMSVDHIVSTGLVVMKDPSKGRLMGSTTDGSMPLAGSRLSLSAADRQTLSAWINSMALVAGTEVPSLPTLAPTFASVSANILSSKCIGCHGAARADKGIRYDSYAATLRTVTANNAGNSKLYSECRSGSMPDRPFARLSADELAAIQMWINTGALNN
jgi:mono/diheme cytochrome c family protein